MQTAIIAKWGNSLALRLPRHIVESVRLSEGASVNLFVEDETLCIRPARKRYKLADLLAAHDPSHNQTETDWGEPVGKEEW
ncbi:MAG: AbrB/MazE/SpoVT family DNA-binding domain-containing protein [Hyphomonadaceae bacterium]